MATKPADSGPLSGIALRDASTPLAQTPRGGMEFGFTGETSAAKATKGANALRLVDGQPPEGAGAPEPVNEYEGLGSWLNEDDAKVFKTLDGLVLRQELIALNHLAQDTHFTRVKLGYPFSTLTKDPNKDVYRCELPAGTKSLSIQAVPNQAWDLVNKCSEAILVDPPQPAPTPLNDSEDAQAASKMAERFLAEDAGENGTNDVQMLYDAVDKALTCATSYIEYWVDPVGGGYVPLQILAHPQAMDPQNPLIGPDGNPTTDPVLRYITAPPEAGGQFTDEPEQAPPQWQPKIRASLWGREHWRVYPETQTVSNAEKVIGLLYCTLGEAKRRWPAVAEMEQGQLDTLLDWTPPRYLCLLPPFERARWRVSDGAEKEKSGSSDERIMFYYRLLQKSCPDHPRGAELIVTGANGGLVLHKQPLSAVMQVPNPRADGQDTKTEVRCMDIPLVQVTPRADPDDRDPTGRCYMELFSGATEFDAALRTSFLEALDQWLHPDWYIPSTSSVQGFQREESRATGDMIPILRPEDKPVVGNQPPIPPNFWQAADHNNQAIRGIASLDKAVTGEQDPTKESGKALQIAVGRAMVGLARMNLPVTNASERGWRIKIQLCMRDFSTPQTIRYVGEDGAWKEEQWKAVDFALVGDVSTKSGTGTMFPPEQKVNYLANLRNAQMLSPDEATDAARPAFAQRLGLPDNPHLQFIERCVALWLKGIPEQVGQAPGSVAVEGQPQDPMAQQTPPAPDWLTQWKTFMDQKRQYDTLVQQTQQLAQMGTATVTPLPPPPPMPWTPFPSRPNDTEPAIAQLWMKRLSKVMSTVKYGEMDPAWRQVLDLKYEAARQIVAQASQPAPEQPGKPSEKPKQPTSQPSKSPALPEPKASPSNPPT